jgi:hypothetical protein
MTPRQVEELTEREYHAFVRYMVDHARAIQKSAKTKKR